MERERQHLPQVVIVGAGFGGLEAARHLRAAPVAVTVIDRSNHHLFQPLLYQVATAGLSPAEISAPIRAVLRGQRNAEVFLAEVTAIDTANQEVLLGDRRVPYDYLILATGARHSYFGHDEWEEYAPGLKSIQDATTLRSKILRAFEAAELTEDPAERAALLTFVIVGGGPTGVEMAGAIAELAHVALKRDFRRIDPTQARIVLVEGLAHLVPAFPTALAEKTRDHLAHLGVEVCTDTMVQEIDAAGVLMNGERIAARTVIWAAGVRASAAGNWLGVPTDRANRVLVLPDLSVPGQPHIFVIGDTAHAEQEGEPLPGVAQVALQQGRYAAGVICGRLTGQTDPPPFRYHDKGNMATVGRAFAIVDTRRLHISGFFAWVLWLAVHITFLIDFRNRVAVLFQWAWAYCTYQRSARLIVEDNMDEAPTPVAMTEHSAER
ncbi:MAG: NAD(P)/FAD-dependent oxidoreductase [Ktedonobacterales bacterium]|nr:NAD(P)/FAD-dependent oxidoreductase [Ktedonobacterales bacterium]